MKPNGYVLVTVLVLLLVLSLVAVSALRAAAIEVHLSTNSGLRMEALEASEAPRRIVGDVLDTHVFGGGRWLGEALPEGLALVNTASWTDNLDEASNCATSPFECATGQLRVDATFRRTIAEGSGAALVVASDLSVYYLHTALQAGEAAGSGCYGRSGRCAQPRQYYYIASRGRDVGPETSAQARTQTDAIYRVVVRH